MRLATSFTSRRQRARIALGTLAIVASLALTGCVSTLSSLIPGGATPTPTATAGYRYVDTDNGFAVTFPGTPSLQPVAGNDNGAMRASYDTSADPNPQDRMYYTAAGTDASGFDITTDELEGAVHNVTMGSPAMSFPTDTELDGLPAVTEDFELSDGTESTVVVAGKGQLLYQLIAEGGTAQQRQAFIDSFELLN